MTPNDDGSWSYLHNSDDKEIQRGYKGSSCNHSWLETSKLSGKECVSPISCVIVKHVSAQKYILYDDLLKLVKTFLFCFWVFYRGCICICIKSENIHPSNENLEGLSGVVWQPPPFYSIPWHQLSAPEKKLSLWSVDGCGLKCPENPRDLSLIRTKFVNFPPSRRFSGRSELAMFDQRGVRGSKYSVWAALVAAKQRWNFRTSTHLMSAEIDNISI